jgi:hypothetical protein
MNVAARGVLLMASSMLVAAPCVAQSIGGFRPTGDMTAPRSFQTATRLQNGRVLIAGCSTTTSAELYDPATGRFTATGTMTASRCGHSATLLADGRVLIAGGDDLSGGHTAELFDPSDGTFTSTGDMVGHQIGHTATLLPNGEVLIAGGFASISGDTLHVDHPELYDPSTGTFSLTGAFAGNGNGWYTTGGPAVSAALSLPDGKVLIAGEPTSELYDPVTGTFQLTGVMTTSCPLGGNPLYIHGRTATLLTNGLALLTGGEQEDCGRFANAELYDETTGTFTATGSMTRARDNHSATLLADGTVLIAGGESADCCTVGVEAGAELFDPSTGTFILTANMSAPRAGQSATLLDDGTVLVAGGYWFEWPAVPCCVIGASAELYVAGGQLASPDGTTVPTATQIVDNSGAVWTLGAGETILRNGLQAAAGYGSAIFWKNSTVYVFGTDSNWWQWTGSGWLNIGPTRPGGVTVSADGTMAPTNSTQIVDNSGNIWTIAGGAAILKNGIPATGGYGSKIYWKSNTVYVYGTDNNWWQWTGSGWVNIGSTQP